MSEPPSFGSPVSRRDALRSVGWTAAGLLASSSLALAKDDAMTTVKIAPEPLFDLSPWLYMQFMEPLGTTDGSVEASWNHMQNRWRPDLVEATKELAPPMLRWGGLFSAYYRWREGVGLRAGRKPMHNLQWGGVETNQVGTAEFMDFCRQVQADPLMCVNFEAEGDPRWQVNELGEERAGNAQEAAEWVSYCNDPDNKDSPCSPAKPLRSPLTRWQKSLPRKTTRCSCASASSTPPRRSFFPPHP